MWGDSHKTEVQGRRCWRSDTPKVWRSSGELMRWCSCWRFHVLLFLAYERMPCFKVFLILSVFLISYHFPYFSLKLLVRRRENGKRNGRKSESNREREWGRERTEPYLAAHDIDKKSIVDMKKVLFWGFGLFKQYMTRDSLMHKGKIKGETITIQPRAWFQALLESPWQLWDFRLMTWLFWNLVSSSIYWG